MTHHWTIASTSCSRHWLRCPISTWFRCIFGWVPLHGSMRYIWGKRVMIYRDTKSMKLFLVLNFDYGSKMYIQISSKLKGEFVMYTDGTWIYIYMVKDMRVIMIVRDLEAISGSSLWSTQKTCIIFCGIYNWIISNGTLRQIKRHRPSVYCIFSKLWNILSSFDILLSSVWLKLVFYVSNANTH